MWKNVVGKSLPVTGKTLDPKCPILQYMNCAYAQVFDGEQLHLVAMLCKLVNETVDYFKHVFTLLNVKHLNKLDIT